MSVEAESLDSYFKAHPEGLSIPAEDLCLALMEIGAAKLGEFKLVHNENEAEFIPAPIYVSLRRVKRFLNLKEIVINLYLSVLQDLHFDLVADIPNTATPFVSTISDRLGKGMITPRGTKTHGIDEKVEGLLDFDRGKTVVLIDDVITRGTSKFGPLTLLGEAGVFVKDVVVLIDREQGGKEELEKQGYKLHSVMKLGQMLDFYLRIGKINKGTYAKVQYYLGKA